MDNEEKKPTGETPKTVGEELKRLLSDPETAEDFLDQVARLHNTNLPLMELVAKHPNVKNQTLFFLYNNTDKAFKARLQEIKSSKESRELVVKGSGIQKKQEARGPKSDDSEEGEVEVVKVSLLGQILSMSVSEKVQFAFKAGKDGRSILIKDSNRQVAMAVLTSPKITEDEILLISQSRNVSDELLRAVAKNRDWMKNYSILLSIVSNPKTPLAISMPLLPSLTTKDLGVLRKSKNVPEGIRSAATRLYAAKSQKS